MNNTRAKKALSGKWNPKPLNPPQVNLRDMDNITRSAESIRYSVLNVEYWLSPNGCGREWLRHVLRVALFLAAPVLLLAPLISLFLVSLLKWSVLLASIAWKLIVLITLVVAGIIVTGFNWVVLRVLMLARR